MWRKSIQTQINFFLLILLFENVFSISMISTLKYFRKCENQWKSVVRYEEVNNYKCSPSPKYHHQLQSHPLTPCWVYCGYKSKIWNQSPTFIWMLIFPHRAFPYEHSIIVLFLSKFKGITPVIISFSFSTYFKVFGYVAGC